jgi:hypothetical protein
MKFKPSAAFKLKSGNKPAFKMMGSSPVKHDTGSPHCHPKYDNEGKPTQEYMDELKEQMPKDRKSSNKPFVLPDDFPTEAAKVEKDSAVPQKEGKIVYIKGKKYYQASDGTLHTGQVEDYERELAEDKKLEKEKKKKKKEKTPFEQKAPSPPSPPSPPPYDEWEYLLNRPATTIEEKREKFETLPTLIPLEPKEKKIKKGSD